MLINKILTFQENVVLQFGSGSIKKLKWKGFFHGCYENASPTINCGKVDPFLEIADRIIFG